MDKENLEVKVQEAIDVAVDVMAVDGDHHKVWGLDQVVRILAGDRYNEIVKKFEEETGREWDRGVEV